MSGRGLIAARWVLLGLTALAAIAAAVVSSMRGPAATSIGVRYTCPMHPEVTTSTPGECPICGMALGPAFKDSDHPPIETVPTSPEEAAFAEGYAVRPVVFTDNVRDPAFVDGPGVLVAHLYVDEVSALEPDAAGEFSPASAPSAKLTARRANRAPSPWDLNTFAVRFDVDANDERLRPGAVGWLRFAPKRRHADLVPDLAVLQSPDGPYVFAAAADQRRFGPRAVRLGKVFFGHAVVISGVEENESVAVGGLFFLDAERRLRQASGANAARER